MAMVKRNSSVSLRELRETAVPHVSESTLRTFLKDHKIRHHLVADVVGSQHYLEQTNESRGYPQNHHRLLILQRRMTQRPTVSCPLGQTIPLQLKAPNRVRCPMHFAPASFLMLHQHTNPCRRQLLFACVTQSGGRGRSRFVGGGIDDGDHKLDNAGRDE